MTILSPHRIALLGSTVALAFASLGGVAQAKHGSDDGAAHHRHQHHAKHHHHHAKHHHHHAEPRDDR